MSGGVYGIATVRMRNGANPVLATVSSASLTTESNLWAPFRAELTVPASAASWEIVLSGTREFGTFIEVFWDDLALTSAVSVPALNPAILIGLAALLVGAGVSAGSSRGLFHPADEDARLNLPVRTLFVSRVVCNHELEPCDRNDRSLRAAAAPHQGDDMRDEIRKPQRAMPGLALLMLFATSPAAAGVLATGLVQVPTGGSFSCNIVNVGKSTVEVTMRTRDLFGAILSETVQQLAPWTANGIGSGPAASVTFGYCEFQFRGSAKALRGSLGLKPNAADPSPAVVIPAS